LLPATTVQPLRITAFKPICSLFLIGVDVSLRPFAHLKRLPVSRSPFQGHRSRPVTSTSRCAFLGPVRPSTPPLGSVCPAPGWIFVADPFSNSTASLSAGFLTSTPLQGFYPPPDQSVLSALLPKNSPREASDFPSLPAAVSITSTDRSSSFQARPASLGSPSIIG
jgi:hypothetical protein